MMTSFVALLLGCDRLGEEPAARGGARPAVVAARPAVVFLGTSLTAGYGLDLDQAFPALIQEKIDAAGLSYQVVNAGVSGETSAGARQRVDWLLRQPVAVLVVETGANDGLRGLSVAALREHIQAIIDRARREEPAPTIVLIGMSALPNLGRRYVDEFEAVYPELARKNDLTLIASLLEGVGGVAALNQADGVHPTAAGQRRMAENAWRVLERVLRTPAA